MEQQPNALRARVVTALDVILRVPALFAMDAILNSGQSTSSGLWSSFLEDSNSHGNSAADEHLAGAAVKGAAGSMSAGTTFGAPSLSNQTVGDELLMESWDSVLVGNFLRVLGFALALAVFFLPTRALLLTYKWLTSLAVVGAAYWVNQAYLRVTDAADIGRSLVDVAFFFMLQGLLALVFCLTYTGPRGPLAQRSLVAVFVLPSLLGLRPPLSGAPEWWWTCRRQLPPAAATVGLAYVAWGTLGLSRHVLVHARAARLLHHHHHAGGLQWLLEHEWQRLRVPHVLRLFWLVRLSEHAVVHLMANSGGGVLGAANHLSLDGAPDEAAGWTSMDGLVDTSKQLLVSGCDTVVAVLGMTSVVSSLAHHLSRAVQSFLLMSDDVADEEKSFGTVSAILFFILALQTGLTGLEPEKRLVRLYRNFCLLFTAILHFVHNMVQPLLLSLSAQRGRPLQQHGRALLVCTFLVAFPAWFLVHLWRAHPVSTWLLAVSAFSVEVAVKVFVSLMVYALFVADSRRQAFWERLDDYVYYVRAVGSSVEFAFGVFLFFNGAWILLFESGGSIRACMMCVHAYFNIWLQARAGWRTFARRRAAVRRIDALPEASHEQLQQLDDVCAICYQEMAAARVTRCKHFFHSLCLRKWLYIQDCCPMCHKVLYEGGERANGEAAVLPLEPANEADAVDVDEW